MVFRALVFGVTLLGLAIGFLAPNIALRPDRRAVNKDEVVRQADQRFEAIGEEDPDFDAGAAKRQLREAVREAEGSQEAPDLD
jgi:hypothetical protein